MMRAVLRTTRSFACSKWRQVCRDDGGSLAMNQQGQEDFPSAHWAGLAGLAAIAVVLVVNVGVGRISVGNPTFGAELSGAQVATPAIATTTDASIFAAWNILLPQEPPKPKVTLSRDQVWEVQAWLKAFNLDPGPIDGIAGPRTFTAVKKFESAHQRPETGDVSYTLLGALRHESGQPLR